jgi:hypothetical protein
MSAAADSASEGPIHSGHVLSSNLNGLRAIIANRLFFIQIL